MNETIKLEIGEALQVFRDGTWHMLRITGYAGHVLRCRDPGRGDIVDLDMPEAFWPTKGQVDGVTGYSHIGKLGPWARRSRVGTRYIKYEGSYHEIQSVAKDGKTGTWRYVEVQVGDQTLRLGAGTNIYRRR